MIKEILFTHDDMDGAGCRIVYELMHANQKKNEDYELFNCSNKGLDDKVIEVLNDSSFAECTHYVFADICPKHNTLLALKEHNIDVEIFDHHVSALESKPEEVFQDVKIIVTKNGIKQSGTSLLYEHYMMGIDFMEDNICKIFNNKQFELLVDTIRSYDTYEWKETNNVTAKRLQTLFFLLGMDNFCEKYINEIININNDKNKLFSEMEMKFIETKIQQEQSIIDSFTPEDGFAFDWNGNKTLLLLGTKGANISELGYQFLHKFPEYDIIVCYYAASGEFSLRTLKDEIRIDLMCTNLGGGGHTRAAGFTLDQKSQDKIINIIKDAFK